MTAVSENPRVTIVTATYNRSQVLKHAVRSVLDSTFTDWELIVVGDGCTDDTEQCVASFGDPRIRFVSLPCNSGGQAAPNNRGIELARGSYIAFLNHDDLFLPHHLAACVAELDTGRADLVWVPAIVAHAQRSFDLAGVSGTHDYTPFVFCSASSWMLRRELTSRVGPWPAEDSVYVTPSQAWLFRAWRSGATLKFIAKVGVVLLYSGARPGSYAQRESPEHEDITRWMKEDPRFLERMLEDAAINAARAPMRGGFRTPVKAVLRGLAHPVYELLAAIGVHPLSLSMAYHHGRRGGYIRHHRRSTGAE